MTEDDEEAEGYEAYLQIWASYDGLCSPSIRDAYSMCPYMNHVLPDVHDELAPRRVAWLRGWQRAKQEAYPGLPN